MRRRAISRPSATLLVAAALGLGVAVAHAGPCSSRIAQFEQAVRQSAGARTPGRWRRNRLTHSSCQPTPLIKRAEEQAKADIRGDLGARQGLDKQGNRVGCTRRWPPLSRCTTCSDPAFLGLSRCRLRRSPNDQPRICCAPSSRCARGARVFADCDLHVLY